MAPFLFVGKTSISIFYGNTSAVHLSYTVSVMKTRICKQCKEEKPLSEYHERTDTNGEKSRYRYVCKPCACQRSRESYRRNCEKRKARCAKLAKARILERRKFTYGYLLTHPCVECGETNPVVLEFDHIDPTNKDIKISSAVWANWSWKRLHAEIEKCQILCANCHKRRTAKQQGWYAAFISSPASQV